LRDSGRQLGYVISPGLEKRDFDYLEHRMAAAVLDPSARRINLLVPAVRAALFSGLDPAQRLVHALWAVALILCPRALARRLLEQRFVFNQRSIFTEGLLRQIWRLGALTSSRRPSDRLPDQPKNRA
jgi:hypothetical protein